MSPNFAIVFCMIATGMCTAGEIARHYGKAWLANTCFLLVTLSSLAAATYCIYYAQTGLP